MLVAGHVAELAAKRASVAAILHEGSSAVAGAGRAKLSGDLGPDYLQTLGAEPRCRSRFFSQTPVEIASSWLHFNQQTIIQLSSHTPAEYSGKLSSHSLCSFSAAQS